MSSLRLLPRRLFTEIARALQLETTYSTVLLHFDFFTNRRMQSLHTRQYWSLMSCVNSFYVTFHFDTTHWVIKCLVKLYIYVYVVRQIHRNDWELLQAVCVRNQFSIFIFCYFNLKYLTRMSMFQGILNCLHLLLIRKFSIWWNIHKWTGVERTDYSYLISVSELASTSFNSRTYFGTYLQLGKHCFV